MTENKKPDDGEFERALSFFLGSCEAQEVDMWDRYDVIKSYAYGYKKLYWDLLESWADLKVQNGVLLERAKPKYKRVDLDELKTGDLPQYYAVEDMLKAEGHDDAIDDIKSKYGDLYVEVKENV